ncbi:HD domain-containing protein [Mesorhizobium sp. PAMC28654]|uniref:HD-GYP domain-containing protein n=1 Tax=Mesorhizobium sp. PAMC28654 TaxID=2880934 RepID=UPI001D0B0239|nr:HD-GYP domain-containing protein [Mesorhizobium sp. PAMC28654]UDL91357.1 HD domain-containing protein [Mesorhizobium sp. PAMC28654]
MRSCKEKSPVQGVGLSELVSALSYALDISEGHPTGHCVRSCWIGFHIGREAGLSPEELSHLYYTLLLKDVGCSSNAARICRLYLADDIALKHDFHLVNDSLPQILRFVLSRTGMKAKLAERFRALLNIAMNGGTIVNELFQTRCQTGAEIVRQMRFPGPVARGVMDLDEHWNGGGHPAGLKGEAISLQARIALIAQIADVFYASAGPHGALAELQARSGTWFEPRLVAACERAAAAPNFWTMLDSPELSLAVIDLSPSDEHLPIDDDYLDDVAAAFAKVVDAKSPFTNGHSERVALFTDMIAEEIGLDEQRRRRLKRAALLHDIGKLGVSNQILDKPDRLDEAEWAAVRHHPALGEIILSRIGAFQELSRIAGSHHERLDGKGYPRGLKGDAIDLDTRIVTTADIFDALTAERPYRAAMPVSKALEIMAGDVGSALDPSCFEALRRALLHLEKIAA